eukprot:582489-Pyramimonas_sp.AAC.1
MANYGSNYGVVGGSGFRSRQGYYHQGQRTGMCGHCKHGKFPPLLSAHPPLSSVHPPLSSDHPPLSSDHPPL